MCAAIPVSPDPDEDGYVTAAPTLRPSHEQSLDVLVALADFFAGPVLADMVTKFVELHPPVFKYESA